MYGDFSRVTYDPAKHYTSVLYQQGRVRLDAEDNELQAILRHTIRTALTEIIGDAATADNGFEISYDPSGGGALTIGAGSYYVDGIRVVNRPPDATLSYWQQPYLLLDHDASTALPTSDFSVFLRVWERTVSPAQDPALREVALGDLAPDTALRGQVVWQVITGPLVAESNATRDEATANWPPAPSPALLMAQAIQPSPPSSPCEISPAAQYRGPENQLYRVEVHTGGQPGTATFKWSRDNASVTFPIVSLDDAVATVTTLGRDGKTALEVGDRVEIVDDRSTLRLPGTAPQSLFEVVAIDTLDLTVTLSSAPGTTDASLHPILRRWDSPAPPVDDNGNPVTKDGALPIVEGQWQTLEDGVQVNFSRDAQDPDGDYVSGDYWLIPARVATGDVEWPRSVTGQPIPRAPKGIVYHYAPLANISVANPDESDDLRSTFGHLATRLDGKQAIQAPAPEPKPAAARTATPTTPAPTTPAATPSASATSAAPTPGVGAPPVFSPLPGEPDPSVNPTAANRPEITPPVIFPGEPPASA